MSREIPDFTDIITAHERIQKYIHRTPVLTSSSINSILGGSFYFKCENFQKIGAFKFRGATNAILSLSDHEAKKGVGTHSSGNHAAALSLAARIRGIDAHIVMPENAPEIKKTAVKAYGGIITFCKPTLESRETTMELIVARTGAHFIPSYNHFNIIAGQGTAAKEMIEDVGELDIVVGPVGGGGLISGTSISTKGLLPGAKVIAAEPMGADDAYRSFRAGKIIPSVNPKTIADGLLTSLGDMTFRVIMDRVDEIVTVSEEGIVAAMRMIWERMKIIIEPSSAVPLAAVLEKKINVSSKKVGIIISGGNVDLARLPF
jgi:threonine dehydratase